MTLKKRSKKVRRSSASARRSSARGKTKTPKLRGPVGFLGGGNMAKALIRGLVARQTLAAHEIYVSDRDAETLQKIRAALRVQVAKNNPELARRCPVLILAVKPQNVADVAAEIGSQLSDRHLLISIVAGLSTATLQRLFGEKVRIVRAMPNTPALVAEGATAVFQAATAKAADLQLTLSLFSAVGVALQVESEPLLDAVTGLSGSGPAYVFLLMEAMLEAAQNAGLPHDLARTLIFQTIVGAGRLAQLDGEEPHELRRRVTSPGGTTLAGIKVLEEGLFVPTVRDAVAAAARRATELSKES